MPVAWTTITRMLELKTGFGFELELMVCRCMQVLGQHGKAEGYRAARALRGQAMEQLMLSEHRWHDLLLEAEPG